MQRRIRSPLAGQRKRCVTHTFSPRVSHMCNMCGNIVWDTLRYTEIHWDTLGYTGIVEQVLG